MKYHEEGKKHEASESRAMERQEQAEYVCTNKNCGKSYPASPSEKGEYQRQYPKPGK